jgi:hypothetical protein
MSVTEQQIIEAFDAVIEERGEDWVYPQIDRDEVDHWEDVEDEWHYTGLCRYTKPNGEYACVWGGVLHKVGERMPAEWVTHAVGLAVLCHVRGGASPNLQDAAIWAQAAQDRGMPYGKVKAGFHRVMGLRGEDLIEFDVEADLTRAGYPDPDSY